MKFFFNLAIFFKSTQKKDFQFFPKTFVISARKFKKQKHTHTHTLSLSLSLSHAAPLKLKFGPFSRKKQRICIECSIFIFIFVFVQNFTPKEMVFLIESVFYTRTHTNKQNKKREVWWFFCAPSFSLLWDTWNYLGKD